MLNTQTRITHAPPSRPARRDVSPHRKNVSRTDGIEVAPEVLLDAEAATAPASSNRDRSSIIGAYLHDLRDCRPMPREVEHDVAVEFRATGDPRLSARLVAANLRLVVKIAKEYRRAHRNLSDLIQEGNLGLLHAVNKYDPSRGVKLSSYASWWIRAYVLNFVMSNHRLVKVGTTQAQRKLFFNLRKAREKLEHRGLEVQPSHLAAALDVSEKEVIEMEQRLKSGEASLDVPSRGKGTSASREFIAAPESRPDVNVEMREFKALLVDKLKTFGATLQGRDLELFHDRLCNEEPARLVDVAERFGVSRERVRQIEERLKRRIRDYLEDEIGDIDVTDSADGPTG
jgi:RNA polymerase sigma-32 factor